MGTCCIPNKHNYTDVENNNELEIREWEIKKLICFKKSFNFIINQSNFDSLLIPTKSAEVFLLKFFSKEVSEIIKRRYFIEKNEMINVKKLEALIFLITIPETKRSESISYYDKSIYVIQEVLINQEDDLNCIIEENNTKLSSFLKMIIEVTFEICGYFKEIKAKQNDEDCYVSEICSQSIKKISQMVIRSFSNQIKEKKSISFNNKDLSDAFNFNKWFLTSGFIRECAFNVMKLTAN